MPAPSTGSCIFLTPEKAITSNSALSLDIWFKISTGEPRKAPVKDLFLQLHERHNEVLYLSMVKIHSHYRLWWTEALTLFSLHYTALKTTSSLKLLYIMRRVAVEVFQQEKKRPGWSRSMNSKYLEHSYASKYLILHDYYLFGLPNLWK